MERHIWKMDTGLGSISQFMEYLKVNSWRLLSRIWTIKQSCTVKVWNLCLEFCLALRRNGAGSSKRWIISSIRTTNSPFDSVTCSVTNQMKLLILLFLTLSHTKSHKIRSMKFRMTSKQPLQSTTTCISIERLFIIRLRAGKWRWWQYRLKMLSQKKGSLYLRVVIAKGYSLREPKTPLDVH